MPITLDGADRLIERHLPLMRARRPQTVVERVIVRQIARAEPVGRRWENAAPVQKGVFWNPNAPARDVRRARAKCFRAGARHLVEHQAPARAETGFPTGRVRQLIRRGRLRREIGPRRLPQARAFGKRPDLGERREIEQQRMRIRRARGRGLDAIPQAVVEREARRQAKRVLREEWRSCRVASWTGLRRSTATGRQVPDCKSDGLLKR